jgi:hypothetical protein
MQPSALRIASPQSLGWAGVSWHEKITWVLTWGDTEVIIDNAASPVTPGLSRACSFNPQAAAVTVIELSYIRNMTVMCGS